MLRATTACNFSPLIWPAGSAPAALASLLFDPPEPQIIGKTQCFATFLPFHASASSFFLYSFSSTLLSSNLSLLSASSLLCFSSVHIVGSLTSKLPSITYCAYVYFIHIQCIINLQPLITPKSETFLRSPKSETCRDHQMIHKFWAQMECNGNWACHVNIFSRVAFSVKWQSRDFRLHRRIQAGSLLKVQPQACIYIVHINILHIYEYVVYVNHITLCVCRISYNHHRPYIRSYIRYGDYKYNIV